MPWFKSDDRMPDHPKVIGISFAAEGLWHRAGCWCSAQLTDGHVPTRLLKSWHAPPELAAELVELGLWIEEPDGWRFHDFLDYQPSREQVLSKRADDRFRKSSGKAPKPFRDSSARNTNGIQPSSSNPPLTPGPGPGPGPGPVEECSSGTREDGSSGSEHEGYRWLHAVLGTFPADLGSWRSEYRTIGSKPAEERERVALHVQATAWCMQHRSKCTPRHILKHWLEFLDGPRNFDQPKPIVAMDFKSQREAAQKAYTKSRLDAFDASEKAFIAMAKTEAERKLRENDWQERRIRLDRSLP